MSNGGQNTFAIMAKDLTPTGPELALARIPEIPQSKVTDLVAALTQIAADLLAHSSDSANPHLVTKAQVGLSQVTNALQLIASNNGSDIPNVAAFRSNLELGSAALLNADNSSNQTVLLDSNGKLATGVLPALATEEFFPVADEAEMLALDAQRGDRALRQDNGRTYILSTDDPTNADNWLLQAAIVDAVTAVNGQTGNVVLTADDVEALPITGGILQGSLNLNNNELQNVVTGGFRIPDDGIFNIRSRDGSETLLSFGGSFSFNNFPLENIAGGNASFTTEIDGATLDTITVLNMGDGGRITTPQANVDTLVVESIVADGGTTSFEGGFAFYSGEVSISTGAYLHLTDGAYIEGDGAEVRGVQLTDTVTAVTQDAADESTSVATTQFVHAVIAALIGAAPAELDTWAEIIAAIQAGQSDVAALTSAITGKLAKASNLADLTDVPTAQANLLLTPGTYTQAYSAKLAALAALTWAADQYVYQTSPTTVTTATVTSQGRSIIASDTPTNFRAAVGADIGSNSLLDYGTNYHFPCVPVTATGAATLTADRVILMPFYFRRSQLYDRVGCSITAQAVGSIRFGIYSAHATTGLPDQLIADWGTASSNAVNAVEVSMSYTPAAGTFAWVFFVINTASATLRTLSNSMFHIFGTQTHSGIGISYPYFEDASVVGSGAPASVPALTWSTAANPRVWLRKS